MFIIHSFEFLKSIETRNWHRAYDLRVAKVRFEMYHKNRNKLLILLSIKGLIKRMFMQNKNLSSVRLHHDWQIIVL